MDCDPNTIDFMPDAHTLLTVVHVVDISSPPNMAACLAGAWPTPADSTFPNIAYYTCLGLK